MVESGIESEIEHHCEKSWDEKSFCAEQHYGHFWVGVGIVCFNADQHQQRLMVSFGSVLSLIKSCKN